MSIFLLLFISAGAIQFPYVQTKLVNYLSQKYSSLLGYNIKLEHISIWWFDSIEIEGISIIDPEGNEMIKARAIDIDFELSSLLEKTDHNVDEIIINGATVYLTKISGEDSTLTININHFIRQIKASAKQKKSVRRYLSCDELRINNSKFGYNDQRKDSIINKFDYYHFTLDSINGSFSNVFTVRDTFGLQVQKLKTIDSYTKLRVNSLKTDYAVSQSAMMFDNLELKTEHSTIKDSIRFTYNSTTDFSNFNSNILIDAQFKNTELDAQDLRHFAPQFSSIKEKYIVNGDFNGLIENFNVKNARIAFGKGTTLRGKIRMSGLPVLEETFIDFNLNNSFITIDDLRPYLQDKTFERIKPFKTVSFSSEFLGFPNDFVAFGNFFTEYGRIDSDINLKIENDINKSSYSGRLAIRDFDLNSFTGNESFGELALNGEVEGKGFTLETADVKLKGEISTIGYNGYEYENIKTDARFAKELFEGNLLINDENLKLDVKGAIDLRGGLDLFNISAKLDTIDLQTLNLSDESFVIKSNLNINAKGLEVDKVLGGANIGDTYLSYRDNTILIDSLSIISDRDEDQRFILLNSNLADAQVNGEFEISEVYTSLKTLFKEYQLSLRNNSLEIQNYYLTKQKNIHDYSLKYEVDINDLNPFLEVFAPDVYISPNTKINGNIIGGYTSILSLDTRFDSLRIKQNDFIQNELQLNISKIADSTDVLAMAYVFSQNQDLSGIRTKDLLFEGIWNNNHIDFEFDIFQQDFNNKALLLGTIDFKKDTLDLKLADADLNFLENTWDISSDNIVRISGKNVVVNNFSIYNKDQSISVVGELSERPQSKLKVDLKNVGLDNLNTVLNKNIGGKINGFAEITDYYNRRRIENNLSIDRLEVDSFLVGDIIAKTRWNNVGKYSSITCNLKREGFDIFDMNGTYSPNKINSLDLEATLSGTELKILEPFFSSYFSNVSGSLLGKLDITGTPTKPNINGSGDIKEASVDINYLKTTYTFNGGFYLSTNKIGFSNIQLQDIFGSSARLDGFIGHDYFKDFFIDIGANFENFQLLNTTTNDNSLFYGNGIASGSIKFNGPTRNMTITANATTQKGTRIYIPIGDTETIEQEEYISFVDFNSSEQLIEETIKEIDLRGIKLDFDLDITNDAYCEIIFDIKSGDIIRGRGNGDLELKIDTKGEFNIFGDFNIEQGGYNFTLYNLINKEFEILPNSKISWYGDPYQGVLDINASYNQLASFLPLLEAPGNEEFQLSDVIEIRRKYPVNVMLGINGPLLSPAVDFDIATGTLPRNIQLPDGNVVDMEFEFLKFKNSIDEQELKRQVFSLIILRKFSPLQSFNTGGSITSSVSELFSNQLSYWITQVDENLEIDVDFGKLDEEAFNTFQLRLSYSFLDGRLRVTRDGGFTNQANQADVSSIAGDWTVEYLLTEDGKLKAKMYNRTNFNPINPTEENQNTVTTGFSLIHTQSFDELKDLFKRSRNKAQQKNEDSRESEADLNTEALLPKENDEN